MNRAYAALDLNVETGLGKAANLIYEGEADGLRHFVEEQFEYVFAPDNPAADVIADGHARLDIIGRTAGSVPKAPTGTDELAKAEAAKDYATTMRLKSEEMARLSRP